MFRILPFFIALISNADCSGTFFTTSNADKKHSAGNSQNIITQDFHECGLENACSIVSSNKKEGKAGEDDNIGSLKNVGTVGKVWKKDLFGECSLLPDIIKDLLSFMFFLFV